MPQAIEPFLGHWYKHVKSENLDELYNCLGYGSIAKAFASKSPSYKLEKLCSYYELANLWGRKIHFKPGNRFHEWDIGNGICRTEISFQDNKVIRVQKGKKQVVTEWDFKEHFLTMTTTVDKVVATRYFERAQYFCL